MIFPLSNAWKSRPRVSLPCLPDDQWHFILLLGGAAVIQSISWAIRWAAPWYLSLPKNSWLMFKNQYDLSKLHEANILDEDAEFNFKHLQDCTIDPARNPDVVQAVEDAAEHQDDR